MMKIKQERDRSATNVGQLDISRETVPNLRRVEAAAEIIEIRRARRREVNTVIFNYFVRSPQKIKLQFKIPFSIILS